VSVKSVLLGLLVWTGASAVLAVLVGKVIKGYQEVEDRPVPRPLAYPVLRGSPDLQESPVRLVRPFPEAKENRVHPDLLGLLDPRPKD